MDVIQLSIPADSSWQNLNPKVKSVWLVRSLFVWLIVTGSLIAIDFAITPEFHGWPIPRGVTGAVLGIIILAIAATMVGASYRKFRFFVGADDLAVQHGVFWTTCRFVSRGRIQHVDVSSGPIERMLGLSQISVHVAGGMHSAVNIPGITHDEAEALRVRLMHGVVPILDDEETRGISPI